MVLKIDLKAIAIVCLVAIIIVLLFDKCKSNSAYSELVLKHETDISKIKDSLGKVITVKDAEIVTNQQSMQDLRAKLFETTDKYNKKVEEVKVLIAQGTRVIIKEVPVPYVDSVKMKKWGDSVKLKCAEVIRYYEDSTVAIGTQAKDSTPYYKIDATVKKEGLKINEIQFIDSQYISITDFKGGFFKRNTKGKLRFYEPRKTKVEIKHTNPYFKNTNTDAFLFDGKKQKKPGYGAGIIHGIIIGGIATLVLALTP